MNRKKRTNTPEELLDKFTQLSVSLPEDAAMWSIQLCSTYFACLSKGLVDEITAYFKFKIPHLTTLNTKALQLNAVRTVRGNASVSYKLLCKPKY